MAFVDGVVIPVPNANKDAFVAHAEKVAELFKDLGALEIVDAWGHDIPEGEITSFAKAVACKPDETVVFAWTIWPSKEVHDKAMETAMNDPLLKPEGSPFDGKRLIYGGFETVVHR